MMLRRAMCLVTFLATVVPVTAAPAVGYGTVHSMTSKILGADVTLVVHSTEETANQTLPNFFVVGSDWRAQYALIASTLEVVADGYHAPRFRLVGIDLPEGNGVLIPGREASQHEQWLRALRTEVIPFVESTWPSKPYRVLYGASNAGLFVIWALLDDPATFHGVIASSPMVGWSPELLIEKARARCTAEPAPPERWLSLVWSDDDYPQVVDHLQDFLAALRKSCPTWLHWHEDRVEGLGHVPPVDVALGLRALFSGFAPPQEARSRAALDAHFAALSRRYGFSIPVPPGVLADTGFAAWREERFDDARDLFEVLTVRAPGEIRGWIGLALVCHSTGQPETALRHAQKAVEIDPGNPLAKRILARVGGSTEPG